MPADHGGDGDGHHGDTRASAHPGGGAPPAFAPGDRIAGRYEVQRFVARGGMGEVFAVADTVLGVPVALKTVHACFAHDAVSLRRFKREVLLARSVSHPSVCRVYDLGQHEPAPGAPPVVFLTMELLAGEPLSARVRGGRLAAADALPLARDMAAALEAAHAAGVVQSMHFVSAVSAGPGLLAEFIAASRTVVYDLGQAPELESAAALMVRYEDTPMDFADATLVLLAEAIDVREVLTLDRRGFAAYRTRRRRAFDLVLDAQ